MSTSQMNRKKQVMFADTQTQFFAETNFHWDDDDSSCSKSVRWYSSEELVPCREEARSALHALQAVNGDLELVDHSIHCVRGIEKFGDVITKMKVQRVLKESILTQQRHMYSFNDNDNDDNRGKSDRRFVSLKTCPEQLAVLSRYLSQPSRDLAYHFALLNESELRRDFMEDQTDGNTTNKKQMSESSSGKDVVSSTLLSVDRVRPHSLVFPEDYYDDDDSGEEGSPSPSKKQRLFSTTSTTAVLRQVSE